MGLSFFWLLSRPPLGRLQNCSAAKWHLTAAGFSLQRAGRFFTIDDHPNSTQQQLEVCGSLAKTRWKGGTQEALVGGKTLERVSEGAIVFDSSVYRGVRHNINKVCYYFARFYRLGPLTITLKLDMSPQGE